MVGEFLMNEIMNNDKLHKKYYNPCFYKEIEYDTKKFKQALVT